MRKTKTLFEIIEAGRTIDTSERAVLMTFDFEDAARKAGLMGRGKDAPGCSGYSYEDLFFIDFCSRLAEKFPIRAKAVGGLDGGFGKIMLFTAEAVARQLGMAAISDRLKEK